MPILTIPAFVRDGVMASPGKTWDEPSPVRKDQYADWGVDVEVALGRLSAIAISLHCWQGDDVGGL